VTGTRVLLAQCAAGVAECALPRTLPWYFGLALAVAWLATVVGAVLLVRRRLITRRDRGRRRLPAAVESRKTDDLELW
jgi:hypothetical protein